MMNVIPTPGDCSRVVRLILALFFLAPNLGFAGGPEWWTTRGVLTSGSANDYAAANQGQAKNIAVNAVDDLNDHLPIGAGAPLNALKLSLSATSAATNDYAPLNLGQLKALAKPFHDRLLLAGYHGHPLESGTYPWVGGVPNDYAIANIGQVKNLFSFSASDLDPNFDSDGNGLPNWWEWEYFPGQTNIDSSAMTPGGVTYYEAYLLGLDPTKADNDGDGVNDGADQYPKDPRRSRDVSVTSLAAMDVSGGTTGDNPVMKVNLDDAGNVGFWNTTGTSGFHVACWTAGQITGEGSFQFETKTGDALNGTITRLSPPVGVSAQGVAVCNGFTTTTSNGVATTVSGYFLCGPLGQQNIVENATAQGITAEGVVWGHKKIIYEHCGRGCYLDLGEATFIGAEEFPTVDVVFDDQPEVPQTVVTLTATRGKLEPQSISTNGQNAAGIYTQPLANPTKQIIVQWNQNATFETDALLDGSSATFKVWKGGDSFRDVTTHVPDTATSSVAINNDGTTVGFSPYVVSGTSTPYIWQGSAKSILEILPPTFQKQVKGIVPVLLSNAPAHLKFTADNLEGPADAPEWKNRTMMLNIGAIQLSVITLPKDAAVDEDPLDSSEEFAAVGYASAADTVAKPVLGFPANFKLRDDSTVFQGWDSTGEEPWTCVAVLGTNSLVKLVLAPGADQNGLELVVAPGSEKYISISNNAVSGIETKFDIKGLAPIYEAWVVLRKKAQQGGQPGPVLKTLHVRVLSRQNIYFDVFYASDNHIPESALPVSQPTPAQIQAELNATFNPQANVNFILRNSFTIDACYGAFQKTDGELANSMDSWINMTDESFKRDGLATIYRIFVVRKVAYHISVGYTPVPPRFYSFVNADARIRTFAHEAGRTLSLPTKGDSQLQGHFDYGPWPVEFKSDGLADPDQQGLMNDNTGTQERWIRQEDWYRSNTNAKFYPPQQ